MEVKELSDARDEARMGLEEAKLAIDKLLLESPTRLAISC